MPLPSSGDVPVDDAQRHFGRPASGWRQRMYIVIFEADTPAGRRFDLALIAAVLASVAVVLLDSVASINAKYGSLFDVLEGGFTALFTIEYIARLVCVRRPLRYARSFFGVIDLLAVLPTYLTLFVPGMHSLINVRILRVLRIFRVLKLGAYVSEYRALGMALAASRRKITVFLVFVMMVVLVMGTLMYLVEGPDNGFTSIPIGIYWAITTMTTVGFGDLAPKTDIGRIIASLQMLLGWGILAVPTGIVSAEFTARRVRHEPTTRMCHDCSSEGHEASAVFCRDCGARLPEYES
jgi:voltage-gated potassium channel